MALFATLETADLLLASIALPMLLAVVAVLLTSVAAALALEVASVPASGTVGDALFRSPPSGT